MRTSHFLIRAALGLCMALSPLSIAAQKPACDAAVTTADMRTCEGGRYQKAQADLQATYLKLQGQMTPSARARLSAAQKAWVRFRTANAAFQAETAAGGTLAPLLSIMTQAEMTEARAAELKKLLR